MASKQNSGGFIKIILIIIVLVIVLGIFKIDLRAITDSEVTQRNMDVIKEAGDKVWVFGLHVWENYIKDQALWVWNQVVLEQIWPIISGWWTSH